MTAWSGFLIATLVEFVVRADRPTGIVDEDTARWLAAALAGDGAVPPTRTARLIAREVAEEAEAFENDAFAALATSGCQAQVQTRQPAPAPPSHPRPLLGKLGGRAQARPVALAELTRKPSLERFARLSVRLEEIEPAPPLGAKTAPLSHERHITEERRFERQDVEARHVGPGIAALEDEKLDVARRGRHAP